MPTKLQHEIMRCLPDGYKTYSNRKPEEFCRLITDQWQPPEGTPFVWFNNGMSLNVGGMTIPFSSDYVLCEKHKKEWDKEYG